AKFANSTVNHSHTATSAAKPSVSRIARNVVSTLPISTTNITGLRAIWRGSSLMHASTTARRTIAGSNIDADLRFEWVPPKSSAASGSSGASSSVVPLDISLTSELSGQVLDDRAERHYWEERQPHDDDHDADEQGREQRCACGERSRRSGHRLLASERTGDRE